MEQTEVTYQKLVTMEAQYPTADLDLIWKTVILFVPSRPAWSGMMQFVQHGNHLGKSSFVFLPIIDMKHSDATPIITFDQPFWWKALLIIGA